MDPTNFIISFFFSYLTGLDDVYLSTSLMLTFNSFLSDKNYGYYYRCFQIQARFYNKECDFCYYHNTKIYLEYSIGEKEIPTRKTVT